MEPAKSGRSKCKLCGSTISKGTMRYKSHGGWSHVKCCAEESKSGHVSAQQYELTKTLPPPLIIGKEAEMSAMFAYALTEKYKQFRSFRFRAKKLHSDNWGWRCFLATIVVAGNKESNMLLFVDKMFAELTDPELFLHNTETEEQMIVWVKSMIEHDIARPGQKLMTLRNASTMVLNNKGIVPSTAKQLKAIKGVGNHIADVTLAWVHKKKEFGVDLHVRRLLRRMGLISKKTSDAQIVKMIKRTVPEPLVGHFSRALVDHGQQICKYTPNCSSCMFNKSCTQIPAW